MSNKSRHLEKFMPYASDRGGLVFRSVRVGCDGEPRGELASDSALPTTSNAWEKVQLSVALERRTPLDRVLHPDELDDPPIAIILAIRCKATFLSLPQRIHHSDPRADKYEHTITLPRNELRGAVSITPYLIRTAPHQRRAGLAWRKGAWLAKGDPWILHIDEVKPRPGNNLEILRKRFSEVPEIAAANHHNWFALQLDGASPRLLLNDEHTTLMTVLFDTTRRGRRAALREALYDQLSASVWPALLFHAAREWETNHGDTYSWQVNILRLWAKRLRPDEQDLDAAAEQLAERALDDPANFSLEISAALQREDQVSHIQRLLTEVSQ